MLNKHDKAIRRRSHEEEDHINEERTNEERTNVFSCMLNCGGKKLSELRLMKLYAPERAPRMP